jgi:bZIP transcription factor
VMENSDITPGDPIVPKSESIHDGYSSSSVSTPEGDIGPTTQDVVQVQKRKGGRKPVRSTIVTCTMPGGLTSRQIYATSEERKQRNRQAQAAFRERRTEYIKQLENTIKHHEDTLQTLQQSHRSAADECLMLRYKNSLLERVLLEKGLRMTLYISLPLTDQTRAGIDVQAELRMKSSPQLGPTKALPGMNSQASPIQRAMMNRQQVRSNSTSVVPPLHPVNTMVQTGHENSFSHPPRYQRIPSQTSSPSNQRPAGFAMQDGLSSPTSNFSAQPMQQQQQQRPQLRTQRHSFNRHSTVSQPTSGSSATPPIPLPGKFLIYPQNPLPFRHFRPQHITNSVSIYSARPFLVFTLFLFVLYKVYLLLD